MYKLRLTVASCPKTANPVPTGGGATAKVETRTAGAANERG